MELQPSALYLTWTLRDEDICSLFPPPPRADMASYARQLGLTMRLAQQHMQAQHSASHHQHAAQQAATRTHFRQESAAALGASAAGGRSETPPPPSSFAALPSLGSGPSPSPTHPLLSRSLAPSLSTYMGGTLRRRSVDDGRPPRSGPAVAASVSAAGGRPQAAEGTEAGEQKWSASADAGRNTSAATFAPRLMRRDSEVAEQSSDDTAESDGESEWEDDDWAAPDATLALHRARAAEGEGGSEQEAGATGADEEAVGSRAADAVLAGEIEARNARTV